MAQDSKTKQSGFAGTLKNLHLIDIIQLCCLSSTTMAIKVTKDEVDGAVFIKNGEVVHSQQGQMSGSEAFYTIMGWDSGLFETFDPEEIPQRTIQEHYQFLLMEASRRIDESAEQAQFDAPDDSEKKLRVLIVDDSPIMVRILTSLFTAQGDVEIVGVARNGEQAIEMIDQAKPDLITLDVNMPVMDGSTALKHIMIKKPCPVVVMSNLGDSSQANVLKFLDLGAVDFMSKPVRHKNILLQQEKMIQRLRRCAKSNIQAFRRTPLPKALLPEGKLSSDPTSCHNLIVINSGAAAPAMLLRMLADLAEKTTAAVVLMQSLPPVLIPPLAEFLNLRSRYHIEPLVGPKCIAHNKVIVSTTGVYMRLAAEQVPEKYRLHLDMEEGEGALVQNCFDLFLNSVADHFPGRVAVVLLSGADLQSLDGLAKIERVNGTIIIQDRSTCTMAEPLELIEQSTLKTYEVPPMQIGDHICKLGWKRNN